MKVLHLPTDVGGNAWGLSRGERFHGIKSDVLIETCSKFQFPADIQLNMDLIPPSRGKRFLKLAHTFLKIRNQYNVFHFNFGRSLLHRADNSFFCQFELPFYPRNAKLFVTYNGCDARQKYPTMCRTITAACHDEACYGGVCNSGERDKERRKGIEKMARYVQHMWALNPDLLYFLPKNKSSFLPYTVSQFECEIFSPKLNKKLHVVHAPTQREAKGSKYIISALDSLKAKYPKQIDYILVENVSHQEARRLYQEADLVIDQVLIGWYGAFAVEAMLMGKPVIVRIAIDDLHFIPTRMKEELLQTVIHADPSNLYEVLEKCIHNREFLKDRGQASLEYARNWHNPRYVASLTKEKYEQN
jgi:glycosyltransferase involved in cell wall biosynthesis